LSAASSRKRINVLVRIFISESALQHLQVGGYADSTVGFEIDVVREYIRDQKTANKEGRF